MLLIDIIKELVDMLVRVAEVEPGQLHQVIELHGVGVVFLLTDSVLLDALTLESLLDDHLLFGELTELLEEAEPLQSRIEEMLEGCKVLGENL